MNALRHGLAAVSVDTTTGTATEHLFADDSSLDSIYQRLRQIEVERVKILNDIHDSSTSQGFDKLHSAVTRLAALERYSQRSHSKLRKYLFRA